NGIALASIQALYQMVQEKDQRIAALESRLANLEQGAKGTTRSHSPLNVGILSSGLIGALAVGGIFFARRRKK
ncbi:MAG TPA: hypothetical protein VGL11_18290, partial [Candidatus Binatia bacterium]